jgi:hypothetical protein
LRFKFAGVLDAMEPRLRFAGRLVAVLSFRFVMENRLFSCGDFGFDVFITLGPGNVTI